MASHGCYQQSALHISSCISLCLLKQDVGRRLRIFLLISSNVHNRGGKMQHVGGLHIHLRCNIASSSLRVQKTWLKVQETLRMQRKDRTTCIIIVFFSLQDHAESTINTFWNVKIHLELCYRQLLHHLPCDGNLVLKFTIYHL